MSRLCSKPSLAPISLGVEAKDFPLHPLWPSPPLSLLFTLLQSRWLILRLSLTVPWGLLLLLNCSLGPHGLQQVRLPYPSQSLLKFMSTELVMPSNQLILCRPLLLLPSIFASIRVFSNELALLIRWPKYWSFSFRISPSSEFSGLIFFRIDWLELLAVHRTLKSLLQHHN